MAETAQNRHAKAAGDPPRDVGRGRAGTVVQPSWQRPEHAPPAAPSGTRDLAFGNPDARLLPGLERALSKIDPTPQVYDTRSLVEDLVSMARERFESDGVRTERVAVTSGALDGIERVLAAHLRPGDEILVEDPGFPNVHDLARSLGLVLRPVPVDAEGLDPAALAGALGRKPGALVLTPRAQNPTGAAHSRTRARALTRVLATAPDLLVVEDDHAADVSGAPLLSVAARHTGPWAVVRSVSKSLGPDLRLAVVAGDAETLGRVENRQMMGMRWVSRVLQQIVVALWKDRQVARLLERAERRYGERRAALVDALAERGVAATGTSGLNVWVPVAEEAAALATLLAAGWSVAPGERFRIAGPPAIRVTVACLDPKDAPALADAIAQTNATRAESFA